MTSTIHPLSPETEPVSHIADAASHKSKKGGDIAAIEVPDASIRGSNYIPSMPEGRSPVIREKVSEDGYHWRKYGQKLVKGNEIVRSYYRCTYPSCHVKKQLECSHGGKIADIVYFGQHEHPKPQQSSSGTAPMAAVEEKSQNDDHGNQVFALVQRVNSSQISTVTSSDDAKGANSVSVKATDDAIEDPISKRQKKTCGNSGHRNGEEKSAGEARVVVQTFSEVDVVHDGHRWRKYGQKMVKGNPNPRSYYRCSFPGCPVKKHVERASHDSKLVLTSYEGNHEHEAPPSRTVSHTPGGGGASAADKGEQVDTNLRSKLSMVT